jgi:hypothetical protein
MIPPYYIINFHTDHCENIEQQLIRAFTRDNRPRISIDSGLIYIKKNYPLFGRSSEDKEWKAFIVSLFFICGQKTMNAMNSFQQKKAEDGILITTEMCWHDNGKLKQYSEKRSLNITRLSYCIVHWDKTGELISSVVDPLDD